MAYKIKHEPRTIPADEAHLLSGMEQMLAVLERNRLSVLIGVGVLLASVAAVGAALWYDARQDEAASDLSRQAIQLYLDRPADKPDKADENLKEAIALYRRVIEQYPRSHSARLALFHLGNALVQLNDLGGAIEAYNKYIATYGTNKVMLGLVHQRLAYAHLLSGDREAARKAFLNVLALPGALNKDQVLFELAKLEESLSRPEGALAYYQDLVKAYPNSPFAGESTIRMKALEVKQPREGGTTSSPAGAPAPAAEPSKTAPSGEPATR